MLVFNSTYHLGKLILKSFDFFGVESEYEVLVGLLDLLPKPGVVSLLVLKFFAP